MQRKTIYWGWYVVFGAFVLMGLNHGTTYCFTIFVKPVTEDLSWSRSAISLAPSITMVVYGIGGIFSGRLLDRIAPRWVMTFGAVTLATALFLTGFVREPWHLYLTYGLLAGIGTSCLGAVVGSSTVAKWFQRKRGLAIGIASVGIGVGSMLLSPLVGYAVKQWGWPWGFWILGGLVLVLGVITAQTLMGKTRPEDYGLHPDGEAPPSHPEETPPPAVAPGMPMNQVLRDSRYWVLSLCYTFALVAQISAFIHQTAFGMELGIDLIKAALLPGYIGLASIGGRFFFGWLSDRLRDAKYAASLGFLFMAAGVGVLLVASTMNHMVLYALLFGFGYGSIAPLMPYLLADRFGSLVLGASYGMLTFFVAGIGGSTGAIVSGMIYDRFGSYTAAWWMDLILLLAAAILVASLKPSRLKTE
ncbi:MAG TPA: MFS transporter [Syntrophales bacterium]|nr:MFS transporter [Syntrophales bacterium]